MDADKRRFFAAAAPPQKDGIEKAPDFRVSAV